MSDAKRRVARRKINLAPWLVELGTIIAMAHAGFPFALSLPEDCPVLHTDIATFEAKISRYSFVRNTKFHEVSKDDPCLALMFYKEALTTSPLDLVRMLPVHMNGQQCTALKDAFVLTCLEHADIPENIVRWRLSRTRFSEMQRSTAWEMVVFRTDIQEPCQSVIVIPPRVCPCRYCLYSSH